VLLYGGRAALPAGGLGLDESISVPVVAIPTTAAHAALKRIARGEPVAVAMRASGRTQNVEQGTVATFSSTGLAFDGRVKPDLVAPGVGLATSDPGANADGSPKFVTVNGSSAAAATVAGAAALLAQARPVLGADALAGLLVGNANQFAHQRVTAQGGGFVDVGAAAAGEVAASPSTLALGRSTGAGWRVKASFTLTNLSTRALKLTLGVRTLAEGAAAVDFTVRPNRITLFRGRSVLVKLNAVTASAPTGDATAEGNVIVSIQGGGSIHIPWAIAFGATGVDLIAGATLSQKSFAASDRKPVLLGVDAGRVLDVRGRPQIQPVRQLDVVLYRSDGTPVGLLARLRDVLPGRYTFGLTGRGPEGQLLPPGSYELRVRAYPVDPGPPSKRKLRFSITE
jgi:hypothetical protein